MPKTTSPRRRNEGRAFESLHLVYIVSTRHVFLNGLLADVIEIPCPDWNEAG